MDTPSSQPTDTRISSHWPRYRYNRTLHVTVGSMGLVAGHDRSPIRRSSGSYGPAERTERLMPCDIDGDDLNPMIRVAAPWNGRILSSVNGWVD
jgi:hypothetical protein